MVHRVVSHVGRRSVVVIVMAAMMGVSALAVASEGASLAAYAAAHGALGRHGTVCPVPV